MEGIRSNAGPFLYCRLNMVDRLWARPRVVRPVAGSMSFRGVTPCPNRRRSVDCPRKRFAFAAAFCGEVAGRLWARPLVAPSLGVQYSAGLGTEPKQTPVGLHCPRKRFAFAAAFCGEVAGRTTLGSASSRASRCWFDVGPGCHTEPKQTPVGRLSSQTFCVCCGSRERSVDFRVGIVPPTCLGGRYRRPKGGGRGARRTGTMW